MGIPPSNQLVRTHAFSFFDIRDGKISRYRLFVVAGFDPPLVLDTSVVQ